MKSGTLTCITTMTLIAALAAPIQLAAQEQQQSKPQPRYKLFDLGTFGGPNSVVPGVIFGINGDSGVQVISNQGTVTGPRIPPRPIPFATPTIASTLTPSNGKRGC